MTYLDFILVMTVTGFMLNGLWFGFIHTLGSLVGLVIGAVVTGRTYGLGAAWLGQWIHNENAARFLAFIGIFLIVTKLVAIIFWVVERTLKFIMIIPFFRTFNRFLGAAFGLLEGTFVCALAVWFMAHFPFSSVFADTMTSSALVGKFYAVGGALSVLLPAALKSAQSIL